MSSSGSTTVTGTSGNDSLNGGSGDDVISGGAGSDRISAGSGDDTLNGGSGSDSLNGGSGNDTLIYNVTENSAAGTRDVYTGGSGVDTVVVEFTLAQWLSSSTQTQIQQYLSHLAAYTSAKTGEVSNGSASDFTFTFGGSTLTVQMMEQLRVFVDGIELNPADQAVLALNDAATLGEDAAGVVIDVLDNDFVPDLVGNLQVASQPAHGTVAVLNNGAPGDPSQWTLKYTPDAGAWNHLAQGETATETFTYQVTDADGDVATATVTLTVTGMNDAVLITSAAQAGAVVEDAQDTASPSDAVSASGTISFSDADLSDGHGASFAPAASNTTALGAFALAPVDEAAHAANGTVGWSYELNSAAAQALAEGEVVVEKYEVTVSDGHGGQATQTVTITITGTNDKPVAMGDTGAADEDGTITGTVAANDGDVDHGAVLSYALVEPVAGLSLQADGSYSFDAGHAAYQHLSQGATETVVVNYTVTDEHGASSTSALTITLTGTNDVPVAIVDSGSATEDAVVTGSVAANDSDADDGAVLTYTLNDPVDGLTLNADGSYSFDAGNAAYQHLAEGAAATVVASYTVTDEHGVSSTSSLTITLIGTNDVPVAVADAGSATEDTVITGSVAANDADADNGAVLSFTLNAPVDGLTLNADGSYSFDAGNAAYQHLAEGATATVVANYTVTDQQGASSTSTLTITLIGTNDVPVAVADTGSATEDTLIAGSVAANDTDADDGAVLSYTLSDPVDGLTLNADGSYSFNAGHSTYQHLAEGTTATIVANYTVTDDHGATSISSLTITLTGTNDVPVAVVDTGSATEDTVITGSVATNDSDIDDGAVLSYALNEPVDGLTLNADGSYSFDAGNAAYQHLAEGATAAVVANYTVTDQHGASSTSTLTITLTGTNDVPVAVADTDSTAEDTVITGSVVTNDSDADDGAVLSYTLNDPVDGLTLNADGSYGFNAGHSAYQHLAEGVTATVVANYTVTDQHGASSTSSLTITLTGTNDAPVAVVDTGSATEDTVITGSVATNDSDADDGTVLSYALDAPVDGLALNADGSYSFDAGNAAYQRLAQGATATVVANYTVTDEHGASSTSTLTITLTGTNDVPVAVADAGSATEDAIITGSVAANDSDVDGGAVLNYSLNAPVDGLTLDADGSYSFDAGNAAYQHLAEGATTTVVANYTVTDDHGATSTSALTITLTGTNDVPVAVVDTDSATEDTVVAGSVATNDSDVDDSAGLIYALNESVDGLTLNADGSYSFNAGHAAYQHLAEGATGTVVADYSVTDEHGATSTSTLTITLTGTNDVPVAVVDTASASEDTVITGSVATNDGDVDDGAVLSYSLNDPVDGLTLNTDGSYSFDAGNAAYQHLAEGATATVVANYTVTDQHGASSASSLTLTLTGTNDVPVALVDTDSATEDTVINGSVATNDNDADDGAVLSYTLNDPVDGLTLNTDGSYSFDAGSASYQQLAQGATATVVAHYTVTDQHGASSTSALTIALTGTNDAPTITSAAEVGAVVEDAPDTPSPSDALAASGTVSFSDADLIDGHTAAFAAAPSNTTALGVFTLAAVSEAANAANGSVGWSYVLNNAAAQSLAADEVVVEQYDVTVSDSHGGQATQTVTITIAGTNDVPTVEAHTGGSVIEDANATSLSTTVSASFNDIDLNDTLTFDAAPAPTNALGGTLTLSTSNDSGAGAVGSVSYVYSVANSATQYLAAGQTATEAFTIPASDGHGGTASQLITVIVTGTNDVPNLHAGAGDTASVALGETNKGLSATGTLTVTDADLSDVVDLSVSGTVASGTTSGLNLTNAQLQAMFSVTPASSSGDAGNLNNVAWTFNSGSQAFDYLGAGESLTLTYTVHAADAVTSDDQTVTVTINGSNDAATNLSLMVTQAPSNNSLPSGDFATITATDPDGGASAHTYSLLSLTEYSSSAPGATPTPISDSTPDLTLASNGHLTATGGIETDRTYELQVQVAQGTATHTETFSIITGTTGGDTINGTNNAATAGDDAVYLLNGGDIVFAGSGDDSIFGQNGNDSLHGGEGNDLLHGGGGNDTFFFETTLNAATNVDTLAGFNASGDLISLSKSVFSSLDTAAGSTLASSDFGSVSNGMGATATFAAGVHVIYDSQTGNLFYDSDGGNTAGGRTLFAVVGSSTLPSTGTFNQSDIIVGA